MRRIPHKWTFALACLALAASAPRPARANRLSGTVRYRDKVLSEVDGSVTSTPMLPARYVTVDFVRAADPGTVRGQATTDANGRFTSPNIGNFDDIVALVKAAGTYEGQTATVRDQTGGGGAIQTYQSREFDLSGGDVGSIYIDITGDEIAGAFNIYDQLIRAHDFIRNDFFATPPTTAAFDLVVRWEHGVSGPGTYFTVDGGQRTIYLLGDPDADNDGFDDSVITHEYGHVAANLYSKDDSPGGPHYLGDVLDLRLAFSEGWANYFSSAVRGTVVYVDTDVDGALIFEIETPAVTGAPGLPVSGPENELACSALIWDFQQSGIGVNRGAIDTPIEALWDVFHRYLPSGGVVDVLLEDFWDGYFENDVTPAYGAAGNKATLVNIAKAHGVPYYEDRHEPNASIADPTRINVGGTPKSGTHYYDSNHDGIGANDEDWYKFTATTGKTYTIETFDLNASGDTAISLYKDDDALLASNDDVDYAGGDLASKIVHTFADGGTHYVRVRRATKPLPVIPSPSAPPRGPYATYGSYSIRITAGGVPAGPTVAVISPVDGATDVPVDTTVVATFSHAVRLDTVTTDSFTVTAGATRVDGTVSLNGTRTVATFTPDDDLLNSTTYAVELTDDIRDDDDRALTPFSSAFTTVASAAPPGPVPRVPRAQIAAGSGYVEVEWVYPAADHDGVIVAVGRTRFPTIVAVEDGGTTTLMVGYGSEVYRGNTDTSVQIATTNGNRAFVCIWTFIGTRVSAPYQLASRATRGGRGIIEPLNDEAPDPEPGPPTLPRPARFQVVAGDGYVDVEFVVAVGDFDGVIVAVGSRRFPVLRQVVDDGALALVVSGGTKVYEGDDRVRFRLPTGNGTRRFACIWTVKGTEYSRPLYAATRAAPGGRGLTERRSFYDDFEEPEPLN
ncbi:MAG: Ig-like domain-containing protein [Planctomycetota bacterium]